jgi:two-component system NtrC family sensor kinase
MIPALEILALQKISALINRSQDLTTILESSLEELLLLLDVPAGFFNLTEAPYESVAVHRGFDKTTVSWLKREQNELERLQLQLAQEDAPIDLNIPRGDLKGGLGKVLSKVGVRSLALYPIRCDKRRVGILGLACKKTQTRSKKKDSLIQNFSDLLGIAITNARLQGQENKLSEDLLTLQEMNKIISQSFDLEEIIQRIVIEGKRLVKTSQCHLFLVDERLQCLVGSASTEKSLDVRTVEIKLSDSSVAGICVTERRTIAVEDLPRDERANKSLLQRTGWRSAIFAPLLTKDQAIGVLICSDTSRDRSFSPQEIFRAETLAHQAAIALENARLFQVVLRSQKEWETTFDAMQDCVSVHDLEGRVFRANRALARRMKTTPPKVIGKHCSEIYDSAVSISSSPCRHNRSLKPDALIVEELEPPLMGGTFQLSVSPWYDKNNRLVGSIHVAKDISNEKLLQQQLIQSEKLSAIGELIAGVAHELNNPLTGVMGYSQLLQLRKDLDDRAKESLLKINNLALRCQKIVQNLLSFARKQKPERTLSDINEILEKTVELRSYELQVNNIELIWERDAGLPKTIVDVHQLQQVFLNVITNAEQAMLEAHGKGKLLIRTSVDRSNQRILVAITDDGPGISEANRKKIFDPFFTTKEVGKGTGLGLSLSYGIIQEHGGNIYVQSRTGKGATFTIELPVLAKLPEEIAATPEVIPLGLQFENLIRDKRILVVDDERYILDFFVEIFQSIPRYVDTANNGRAAMEKIRVKSYDLVITDFKMPLMSGRELFGWIKEHRPDLLNRVIFVTGDTFSDDTRSFLENNHNRFLTKPFKIDEVKEVIQETLAEKELTIDE